MDKIYLKLKNHLKSKFSNIEDICSLVEDLIHDTIIIYLRRKKELEKSNKTIRNKYSYLLAIADNLAIKLYNYESKNLKDETFLNNIRIENNTIENDFFFLYEKGQKLLNEMESLVLDYYYFKEYSFKEISELCGIKQNTLLSHHRRALQKLRPLYTFAYDHGTVPNDYTPKEIEYFNLLKS